MITGRRTYDQSLPWWGGDGPTGAERLPLFVLTHRTDPPPVSDVYTFVTEGVDAVVAKAREAAGEANIGVSGVEVGRRLIEGVPTPDATHLRYRVSPRRGGGSPG